MRGFVTLKGVPDDRLKILEDGLLKAMKGQMYETYIETSGQAPDSVAGRAAWQAQLDRFYAEGESELKALGMRQVADAPNGRRRGGGRALPPAPSPTGSPIASPATARGVGERNGRGGLSAPGHRRHRAPRRARCVRHRQPAHGNARAGPADGVDHLRRAARVRRARWSSSACGPRAFVFLVGLGRLWGERSLWKLAASALALCAVLYGLFVRVLGGNFPEGPGREPLVLAMDAFLAGLAAVAEPQILFLVFAGTVLGIVVGALPGISGSTTTALLLPLTITMTPNAAIAFLGSIYCAANYGGSITAILINTPGDPSASATAFDGYPLAKRGEAGRALGMSAVASAIGGIFSVDRADRGGTRCSRASPTSSARPSTSRSRCSACRWWPRSAAIRR